MHEANSRTQAGTEAGKTAAQTGYRIITERDMHVFSPKTDYKLRFSALLKFCPVFDSFVYPFSS